MSLSFERMAYGKGPRQFVEISGRPSREEILPVFIHGGYWRALEAESHRFVLPALHARTGAVANLEYRLLPHVSLPEIVADVAAGLRLISNHFGCRVAVIGHSAGGHLAVMSARQLPDTVVAAVAISGFFDLTPLAWSFLREEVGLTSADLNDQSPQEIWVGHTARQVLLAVGQNETPEFHRQAQMFASSHGATFVEIPATHHMTVLDDLAKENGTLIPEINALIDSLNPE
ncbi:alpha/beta hydrolase [Falsihalocynthiibacter arcticus]|uniref:alpha/beta hydrolase n=1 Tax=Falsihalocynthiibacter arcticus TaxID=1579316 RepID=UPI00146FD8BA|nr:alpha/beta hydrolase [Falsihalocynthiibacter arcticus]